MFKQQLEPSKMVYQAFFFDFDGVLADSVEVKTEAFAAIFEAYGQEIQARVVDHHRKNGGMTRKDKFKHYYAEFLNKPLPEDEMERLCKKFSSLVVEKVVNSPEIPGAEKYLKKWYRQVPCFVVSAAPDEELIEIVRQRGLTVYFKKILGSSRSKKENLELLLKKYGFNALKCMFFGDAGGDYLAAKALSINFIGILPGPEAPLLQQAPEIKWFRDFHSLNEDVLNES